MTELPLHAGLPERAWTSNLGKLGLALLLAGTSAGVYAIKKATAPPPLGELPTLARVPPPPASSSPVIANEATLEEELRLVHGAQAALQNGDTSRAFSLLYEHATRFPKGKLTAQRQVTHLAVLCRAGKVADARREVTEFLAKNPPSPLSEQVQAFRCAE